MKESKPRYLETGFPSAGRRRLHAQRQIEFAAGYAKAQASNIFSKEVVEKVAWSHWCGGEIVNPTKEEMDEFRGISNYPQYIETARSFIASLPMRSETKTISNWLKSEEKRIGTELENETNERKRTNLVQSLFYVREQIAKLKGS